MSLPKSPDILDILERFPFCWNRDPPHLLAPARDWNGRKTKAADEKGPIPHDGDLKSGTVILLQQGLARSLRSWKSSRTARQAIRLGGETVQVLNDQGYSYMLRGNLSAARRKFEKAYSLDPTNPVIVNNLELLNGSRRFIERPPNNQP